jgi:hypothetical protein
MITSRRGLSSLALGLFASTALSGCQTPPAAVVSAAQAVANDAAAILALGLIPTKAAAIAQLVLTGFQALLGVISGSLQTGASTETTVIASLVSAVKSLQADVSITSPIHTDANTALTLLDALDANSTASAQAQAEGAVGAALIAYLELKSPQSGAQGVELTPTGQLVIDARTHIAILQNN